MTENTKQTENTNQTERKIYDGYEPYNNSLPFHDFKANPLVVGRIEDAVKIRGLYGESWNIVILDEYISLSNVALRGLEKYIGKFVRIEYLGEGINEKTGFTYKKYDVQIKKE